MSGDPNSIDASFKQQDPHPVSTDYSKTTQNMALETCFQVSTISTSSTTTRLSSLRPKCFNPLNAKLKLPSDKTISNLPFSSSSSPVSVPKPGRNRTRLVCYAKNVVDEVVAVTEESWNSTVKGSETPVLVEFWAPWCGPCRMIEPVMNELAKEYAGKIACCKVNTDDSPNIATKHGIRSIPTVLVFKNGERKECIVGAVPKSTLCDVLEKYLES